MLWNMRMKAFFFLLVVLVVFILSFDKILFFIDLNKISLNAGKSSPELLARNYFNNGRLRPLLEMSSKDSSLLSYLGREFLKNYESKKPDNDKKFFLPLILEESQKIFFLMN